MLLIAALVILIKMAAATDMELHEKFEQMLLEDFIEYFNSLNYTWKMKFYNKTRSFYDFEPFDSSLYPSKEHDEDIIKGLPVNFDSRVKWPNCETIKEVYDQDESCGSCWAFGSVNTASDRTCIHKDIHVHLAEQDLECIKKNICDGGSPHEAFKFWMEKGLVTDKCKPYDIEKLKSFADANECKQECVDKSLSYAKDKHFAEKVYKVEGIENIKAELVTNGPVEAGFNVFEDFIHYHKGVYVHKTGRKRGRHSVRVIGYGVEDNVEYWLVVNSWNPYWGEEGHFRVKMNQTLLEFEDMVFTGIPSN